MITTGKYMGRKTFLAIIFPLDYVALKYINFRAMYILHEYFTLSVTLMK